MVASQSAGKVGTAAILDGKVGTIVDGVEKSKATNNIAYTLVKFTGVWLTGDEDFAVAMNNNKRFDGGQAITGNLRDYFPQLVNIKYWDDTPDRRRFTDPGASDIDLSGEKTPVWSWPDKVDPLLDINSVTGSTMTKKPGPLGVLSNLVKRTLTCVLYGSLTTP
ncbi:MAG: hypothetical protein LBI79_06000 [Nitrososphaerota archaeon]|nr:hypothetical protein [Nitrososphaerota archaeon]